MTSQSTARPLLRAEATGYAVGDLVGFLEGSWQLSRRVMDHSGRLFARFSGMGWYERTDKGLFYGERGELCSSNRSDVAWRELNYELVSRVRTKVFFSDGSAFHDLDLSSGSWNVTHRCGADLYAGRFLARTTELFDVQWRMSGPTEHYVIETTATRDSTFDRYLRP